MMNDARPERAGSLIGARGCRAERRGFVTLLAIALMALVAVALAGLTGRMNLRMREAREEQEQAQTDQLILAGLELSRQDLSARSIPLPTALVAQGASLRVVAGEKEAKIQATVGKTQRRQTLHFPSTGSSEKAM